MSPLVESEKHKPSDLPYFRVLLNDPSDFNDELFDSLAKKAGYDETAGMSLLKFIVVSDVMFVFPDNIMHDDFWYAIKDDSKPEGRPQCAGRIVLRDVPKGAPIPKRVISDHSYTLNREGILSTEDSNKYKMEIIAPKLGPYFQVK